SSRERPAPPHDTLSLHDALPICRIAAAVEALLRLFHPPPDRRHRILPEVVGVTSVDGLEQQVQLNVFCLLIHNNLSKTSTRHPQDRKSTRLNSSHVKISYAVFCL